MYPFAEQLIAYKAQDEAKRIGGLVLEVKGDFCHKVRGILERYERADDYIEVSLHSEYRYNPLHNDLDAYALAYSIAALLNNLFGKGKEPFWQQAYTNLVKFIILLHKVAYDYVTLFDVYECAISPEVLEKRIEEAEKKLSKFFIEVTPETYTAWVSDLKHSRSNSTNQTMFIAPRPSPNCATFCETRRSHSSSMPIHPVTETFASGSSSKP